MRMAPYTPLVRPRRYFAAREINFFRVMAVVGVLLFAGPLTIYGVGWVMTDHVDGTVRVDNPERPPESYCDVGDCEEPAQVERNVDGVIWDAMDRLLGPAFLVYPLLLGVLTLLLHGGVWLVGGEQGWFATFAVVAWGVLPSLAVVVLSLVGLWLTFDPVTLSPGDDVGAALASLETQAEAFRPYRSAGTLAAAAWGGIIWRAGLIEHQGLRRVEATLSAGLVAAFNAAGALLL